MGLVGLVSVGISVGYFYSIHLPSPFTTFSPHMFCSFPSSSCARTSLLAAVLDASPCDITSKEGSIEPLPLSRTPRFTQIPQKPALHTRWVCSVSFCLHFSRRSRCPSPMRAASAPNPLAPQTEYHDSLLNPASRISLPCPLIAVP